MAPPRCFQCGTQQDGDDEEEWVSCKGKATPNVSIPTAHVRERKYCSECVEWRPSASQDEYLCVDCDALIVTASTQQTAPDATQDDTAGEDELGIRAIEDAYLASDDDFGTGDILHYRLGWEGQDSQDDTVQPFYTAEVETPERKYYRGWGVPTDSSPRAEDQAADNPFYSRLCQGYYALCEPLAMEAYMSTLLMRGSKSVSMSCNQRSYRSLHRSRSAYCTASVVLVCVLAKQETKSCMLGLLTVMQDRSITLASICSNSPTRSAVPLPWQT